MSSLELLVSKALIKYLFFCFFFWTWNWNWTAGTHTYVFYCFVLFCLLLTCRTICTWAFKWQNVSTQSKICSICHFTDYQKMTQIPWPGSCLNSALLAPSTATGEYRCPTYWKSWTRSIRLESESSDQFFMFHYSKQISLSLTLL